MPQQNLIPAPLMWVFLFFSLAVSVATRQLIWLMVVVSLLTLITNREAILSTPGMKKAAMLFACIALPGLISLLFSVNLDRGISAVFRFAAYALAAWVVLSVKIEEGDAKRIMSFLGILLVAWAVDGFVQLLTGVSLLGDPLVELGEEGAIVTGSLQLGYGATLAILSPFFPRSTPACRWYGRWYSVASCLCSNRNEWASVIGGISSDWSCRMGDAGLAQQGVGAKRQVTGFVISAIIGLLLGVYLSVVTGQVSTLAEAPATVSVIPLSVPIMGAVLAGIQGSLVYRRGYAWFWYIRAGNRCQRHSRPC